MTIRHNAKDDSQGEILHHPGINWQHLHYKSDAFPIKLTRQASY